MLDPFTNFDSWLSNAAYAINNPTKFEEFYSIFEGFLANISQTGLLPDRLAYRTGFFIDKLNTQFCKSIINSEEKNDVKLPIIRQYLDLFLKFSLYGIASYDKAAINLAITILSDGNKPFYQATSRHSIYKSLCKKYVEYGAMKLITEKFSDPIQDLELYKLLITLVSVLNIHDQNYDPTMYIKTSAQLMQEYLLKNQLTLNVEIFCNCIEEIRNALPNKHDIIVLFISEFLPLITFFFPSHSFEQRFAAVKEVSLLTTEDLFHKQIGIYFQNNINLVENLQFRSEYASCIGNIISLIARLDCCTAETVQQIWEKKTYLHDSETKSFYDMFLRFAQFGKGPILQKTIELIFSLEHNDEWFDLLDSLLLYMKDRKDCGDYLNQIRDFLMKIIFVDIPIDSNQYEDNLNILDDEYTSPNKIGRAKSSLLMMITYGASECIFLKVVSLLSHGNNNYVLHLLNNFFNDDTKIKISPDIILRTLDKTLDLLIESTLSPDSNGPSEEIKSFILKLCRFNKDPLTIPQLEKIFSCYRVLNVDENKESNNFNADNDVNELKTLNTYSTFPNFFKFLDSLAVEDSITPDHLELLLSHFHSNDRSFFKLIKHLIYEANDSNPLAAKVTHLPLNKEDLLWNFALIDSPQRLEFDKLLCQIYASNDGQELSDQAVIDAFLDKWQFFYNQQMNIKKNSNAPMNPINQQYQISQLCYPTQMNPESQMIQGNSFYQINQNYQIGQDNQMYQTDQTQNIPQSTNLNLITSLPILIDILRLFIYTMECQSSLNFSYAHKYESEKIEVTVYWQDQSNIMHFVVPPSATIGSIIESISNEKNIKISTPVLTPHNSYNSNKPLKRTQTVGVYAEEQPNGKKEAMLDIRYEKSHKVKLHKRDARVSSEVINSVYIDDIFNILLYEENDLPSYNLFKFLPQYKKAPDFKKIDFEDPNLDLRTLFPFDHLCFFLYNMISLLIDSSEDINIAQRLIEFKNFDSYLIDAIEHFIIGKENKSLNELSADLVNYFLDFFNLVPLLDEKSKNKLKDASSRGQRLFVVLIKLSLNPSLFKMVKKVCDFQFQTKSENFTRMPYPDDFDDIFKMLILNEEKKVRDFAVSQFEKINIPVRVFTDCLSVIGDSISEEFLSTLTSHLSNEIINEPRFCQIILNLLYSGSVQGSFLSNILTLILNLLQIHILDKKELPNLLEFLINRFITVNCNKNDRVAFETASKCLVLLSSEKDFLLKQYLEKENNKRTKPFHRFQIDGSQIEIAKCNKVGLKNLGMTCYLNATLQQFYSIKPFRYAIMNYNGDNEFMKQLAILFQNMKYSKTKSVTTQGFVDNFLLMGEKLNPRCQQDATEFILSFFDLFQDDQYYKNLVDELFKVVITNSIRGLENDDYYENDTNEPSYVFELEVNKQLHSINDGFEHFIKPNYLTGQNMYRIGRDKLINAVNYSVLSRIPPFLIIHLKRFEFNQDIYERKKISQRYEVLKEINIAKYTNNKDQEAIYSLTGIIIHRGIALGGHYISFVKTKKNGWLCFDDETVTEINENEVMQQASGIEKSNIAGYILFYQRENYFDIPCNDLKDTYALPESRKIEIDTLNEENLQQQLVCSSGYFELMKGLSNLINNDYLETCLKYSVSTLPFAKAADNSKELYNTLSRRVKSIQMNLEANQFSNSIGNNLISYISNNGFLSSSLFECPIEQARKGIVKLIKSCFVPSQNLINDTNFIDCLSNFAREVFKLVPNCLLNYTNIDQLFNVLSYFVRKFPVIKKIAETEWNEEIRLLFINGTSLLIASKPNLRIDYVFRGMNLTHFLKFVCNIDLSNGDPTQKIFSDPFYEDVLISATKPKAISLFTNRYYSREQFISIFQKQKLINEDCYKLFSLIFHIVPDQAVNLAMTCEFKKISYPCKNQDIITLMASMACMFPKTAEIIVNSCNEWMPVFLTDDDYCARNNAVVCALYTVPSQTITNHGLLDLDIPKFISLPVEMEIKTRPVDDEIINRSKILFKCALEVVAPKLAKIIIEKSKKVKQKGKNMDMNDDSYTINRACQFFQLLNELLLIIPNLNLNPAQWDPITELYQAICKCDTDLFSEQMSTALSVINTFNIPLSFDNLMLSLGINLNPDGTIKVTNKAKNYSNLHNFLPHFISLLNTRFTSIILPIEFLSFFFDNIAFAPIGKVSKSFEQIKAYVNHLCKIAPNEVNEILQSKKMKKWETNNICMIIAVCEFLNKKRIILPHVAQSFKEIVKAGIDVNDVVLRAINRSMKNAYNEQTIDKLCEESKLNAKVKEALRNLLQ